MPVYRNLFPQWQICLFILWIQPLITYAQGTDLNALDNYQVEAPVSCRFTLLDDNAFQIYAVLDFNQTVGDSLWVNYSWTRNDQSFADSALVQPGEVRQVLKWSFEEQEIPQIIVVRLNWQAREWVFQEHFPMPAFHASGGVSLWQASLPLMKSWIHLGDSVLVGTSGRDTAFVYFYSHQFDPARPPMTVNPGTSSTALSIDSVFTIAANKNYAPSREGLYFFQADSSGTLGTSLVVTHQQFPKPTEISDLTQPLVYISTKAEYQELKADFTSKQALDKFWLSTVGSPEKARIAIKNYYQNIEDANLFFTSYKEGWKTDMGMIYAVLGRPLRVSKGLDNEFWTYLDIGGEEINFEFKKVSNIFSNNHYELFRDTAFDRTWFRAIDQWREGLVR